MRDHGHAAKSRLFIAAALAASFAAPSARADEEAPAQVFEARIAAVFTPQQGLTADRVAERAEATSWDVAARREEVRAALAAVEEAKAAWIPQVSLSAGYTRLSSIEQPALGNLVVAPGAPAGPIAPGTELIAAPLAFPVILDMYSTQASLGVPLSDYLLRIPQRYAAASKSAQAAEHAARATRLAVALEARRTYYNWVRAKLQTITAEQALEQTRAHHRDARSALEAGSASKADVERVSSQVAQQELLLVRTRHLAELLETQLRIAMHDEDRAAYAVGEDVREEVPFGLETEPLEELWIAAFAERPELAALEASAAALFDQAKIARARKLPQLQGFANAYYQNPNQRIVPMVEEFRFTWDAGVRLSWTPSEWAGASAQQAGLQAQAAKLQAERALVEDGIRMEVMQAQQAMREARAAIEATTRGLEAAEESYRVRRALYQNGRATAVEVTDAESELTRARLAVIDARIELRVGRARLARALGRDPTLAATKLEVTPRAEAG